MDFEFYDIEKISQKQKKISREISKSGSMFIYLKFSKRRKLEGENTYSFPLSDEDEIISYFKYLRSKYIIDEGYEI